MPLFTDLLSKGFFPKELPPVFQSRDFGNYVGSLSNFSPNRLVSKLERHSVARAGGLRRRISIPHPQGYIRLCREISDSWTSELDPYFSQNSMGVSRPIPSSGSRAIQGMVNTDFELIKAHRRSSGKFLVLADIQNFYPSIYTHSIPWALHSKATAKANHTTNLLGNRLDVEVRNSQDKQTMGIPIGPDTSWVIAEVITVAVESALLQQIPGLAGYRYWDDFEIACDSVSQAEEVLLILEESLAEYELSLNPRKTKIVGLPYRLEREGISEIRTWEFGNTSRSQQRAVVAFFDRLTELRTADPQTSASAYGISRLAGLTWYQDAWDVAEPLISQFVRSEPSVLSSVAKLLAVVSTQGMVLNSQVLGHTLNETLKYAVPLRHYSEVSWILWIAHEHQIQIDLKAAGLLSDVQDSIVALLAMLCEQDGLISGLNKSNWALQMTTQSLDEENWLLSYESRQQGWLPSVGPADHRLSHPLFSHLASAGISFLDLTASSLGGTPGGASGPGSGGGGGPY